MIKKILSIALLITSTIAISIPKNITVRPAQETDLPSIYHLDRAVSFEYFKPLYLKAYAHLDLGKNPDYYLELELEEDKVWFPKCIQGETDDKFIVAHNASNNTITGFIIVHKEKDSVGIIDLLLILKEYRGQGIGKALVHQTFEVLPEVKTWEVTPFRLENKDTLAFYEKLGFKNMGIPTFTETSIYGFPYSELYFQYQLDLSTDKAHYPMPTRSVIVCTKKSIR